jgi:hypothetical protein
VRSFAAEAATTREPVSSSGKSIQALPIYKRHKFLDSQVAVSRVPPTSPQSTHISFDGSTPFFKPLKETIHTLRASTNSVDFEQVPAASLAWLGCF